MSKDFISFLQEDAVDGSISCGGVANVRGSLFGGMISRNGTTGKKHKKSGTVLIYKKKRSKLSEADHSNNFSVDDVNSKIDKESKKSENKHNTVAFGLENEDGKIVKVYVPREEANDFHKELEALITDENSLDVEEILFKLRNEFTIVDVDWGKDFEEDEEEQVDNKLEGSEKPEDNIPEELPDDQQTQNGQNPPNGTELPPEDQTMGEPTPSNQDILMKVLDMLKAQSDAKASEAKAEQAKAEMQKQKLSVELTNRKVEHEMNLISAENHYKKQQEDQKENDRIKKLAKYRSEIIDSQQFESVEEPSKFMNFLDIFNEDVNDDISRLRLQISDLTLRKTRAMKVFDDQINNLNKQLTNKQNLVSKQSPQSATNPQPNMQQPTQNPQ